MDSPLTNQPQNARPETSRTQRVGGAQGLATAQHLQATRTPLAAKSGLSTSQQPLLGTVQGLVDIASGAAEPAAQRPSPIRQRGVQLHDCAVFFLDRHGRVTSWNQSVHDLLGWAQDEWLGQPGGLVFEPQVLGLPQRELQAARDNGFVHAEGWVQRKNGSRFFASTVLVQVLDGAGELLGFVKLVHDGMAERLARGVRERLLEAERRAHRAAEQRCSELLALLDLLPQALLFGHQDELVACNRAACDLLGCASPQALQQAWPQRTRAFNIRLQRDGALASLQQLPFRRALQGVPALQQIWLTHPLTGLDLLLQVQATPWRDAGGVAGALLVLEPLQHAAAFAASTAPSP